MSKHHQHPSTPIIDKSINLISIKKNVISTEIDLRGFHQIQHSSIFSRKSILLHAYISFVNALE
jgi:hypothetical protein